MPRKTMLTLSLLAALITPTVWGAEPPETPLAAPPTVFATYKTWPESEQALRLRGVADGIWAAFEMTGSQWDRLQRDHFRECWIEPRVLREDLMENWGPSWDQVPLRRIVWFAYRGGCGRPTASARGGDVDSYAIYQTWPAPRQIRYVEDVMEGIEVAFENAFKDPQGRSSAKGIFEGCKAGEPAVREAAAKAAGPQDAQRSMAKLVFTAYEAACRQAKAK